MFFVVMRKTGKAKSLKKVSSHPGGKKPFHYHKEAPCIATFISNKHKSHFFPLFFFYKMGAGGRNDPSLVCTYE
jgi:hypothetical protein